MLVKRLLSIFFLIALNTVWFVSTGPIKHRHHLLGEARHLLDGVKEKLFSGPGTFYRVGTGSCGKYDRDNDLVVAVNKAQMANKGNPNNNPRCDQMVHITGDNGSITARIVDTCASCKSGALDMSPKVFKKVCGALAEGVCNIKWKYA